jgi:hypothetical protein
MISSARITTAARTSRAHTLSLGALLFVLAIFAFAASASNASAAYDMTAFDLTPADTLQAGGHSKITYFADFDSMTGFKGGDDVKKVVVDYPAGLLANPETTAGGKCTDAQYLADTCPATSKIGDVQMTIRTSTGFFGIGGTTVALGGVYVMDQTEPGAAATIAFIVRPANFRKIFLKTKAAGIVGVRGGLDGDYGLTLTIDNIPTTLTTLSGGVQEASLDRVWVQTPQKINTKYFSYLPTRCDVARTRIQATSAKGLTLTPFTDTFTPTGCANVPFTPTGSVTPTSTTIGSPVGWNAVFNVDQTEATIQQSHVKNVTVDLPVGTTLNFPGIAAIPATCAPDQLQADACPAGSKIGTASAAVPFLVPPTGSPAGTPSMPGDIYLMSRLTSVQYGYVLRSKDGMKATLQGSIGAWDSNNDGSSDWIRATANLLPQAPWSQVKMNFTTQMINNPAKCATSPVTSTIDGYAGKSATLTNSVTFGPAAGSPCPGTNNNPVVSINTPTNGSSLTSRNVPVNFSATDPDAGQTLTVKCELFSSSNLTLPLVTDSACTSPKTFATGADGNFTVKVTATDSANPPGVTTASTAFTVDSIAPNVVVTSPANDGSTNTTGNATLDFVAQDAAPSSGLKPVTCVLTRTAPTSATIGTDGNCTTPKSYAGLTNGSYSFTVSAQDNAGNSKSAVRTFTVSIASDTTPPSINITAPGSGATLTSSTVAATWSISDSAPAGVTPSGVNASTIRCSLAGPTNVAEAACSATGNTFSGVANGSYTLTVKASDNAGNPATATRAFSVNVPDTVAPTVNIIAPTAGQTISTNSVTATWSSADTAQAGATASGVNDALTTCSLAGPTPTPSGPCVGNTKTFNGLAQGSYTLSVIVKDNAGNTSLAATRAFTVLIEVPDVIVNITAPTAGQNFTVNSVTAAWNATVNGSSANINDAATTCGLTNTSGTVVATATCTGGTKTFTNLANGNYTLTVTARDLAGNVGQATRNFNIAVVDNVAPTVTINTPTANQTLASSSVTATWTLADTAQAGVTPTGVNDSQTTCSLAGPTPTTTGACTGGSKTFSGLANGNYTLTVTARDVAGNTSVAATRPFTVNVAAIIDNVAPTISITAPTVNQAFTVGNVTAAWGITDTAQSGVTASGVNASSIKCSLAGPTAVAEATCSATGNTFNGLSNGSYTLTVKAADNAGNLQTATRPFTVGVVDNVAPTVTISTPTAGQVFTTSPASVAVTFAGTDTAQPGVAASGVASYTCSLAGPTASPAGSCTSVKTYAGLANGSYTVSVLATDVAGNVGTATTRAFTVAQVDNIGPTITISAPTEGQVVTTDSVTATWSLADTAQSGVTASGVNDTQTTCSLTGPTPTASGACTGGTKTFSALQNGSYTLTVVAKDNVANQSQVTRNFTINRPIDNVAPTVSISTPTAGQVLTVSSASVAYVATDTAQSGAAVSGVASVTCTLTGPTPSAAAPCGASPKVYTNLANGSYTVSIFATDAQGNSGSATPTTRAFSVNVPAIVDNVAPTINITAPTANQVLTANSAAATWGITDTAQSGVTASGVNASSIVCSLAGPTNVAETSCTATGKTFTGLSNGSYTLTVKANDVAGNLGQSTRVFSVAVVDNVPPTTTITAPTLNQVLTTNSAAATWNSTDTAQAGVTASGYNDAVTTCALAGPTTVASATCTGGAKTFPSLSNGAYTLTVVTKDVAGNTTTTTRAFSVAVVDAIAPVITITAPTVNQVLTTTSAAATWTITDTAQAGVTASGVNNAATTCALTGPTPSASAACPNGAKTFTSLTNGSYTLTVNAADVAGNTATPVSRTFSVNVADTVGPTVSISAPTANQAFTTDTVGITFTGTDTAQAGVPASGVASFTCSLAGPTASPAGTCTSTKTYTGLANGSYTASVLATDVAGNVGVAATRAFTVAVPIDNLGPTVTINTPTNNQVLSTGTANATWTIADVAPAGAPVAGVKDSSTTCALAGPTPTASALCPGNAKTFNGLANGSYTLTVVGFDNLNNSTSVTRTFSVGAVDTVAPTVAISAPTANQAFTVNTVGITFTGTDTAQAGVTPSGVASFTCSLAGPTASAAGPCTSVKTYSSLANGSYTASVLATDGAGNVGTATTRIFTVAVPDTIAPTVAISAPTANQSFATNSVGITFTGTDTAPAGVTPSGVASFTCSLAGPTASAAGSCTSVKTYSGLANGSYTASVLATDAAGNVGTATTRVFTVAVVDNVGPTVNITAPTEGQILTVNSAAASWTSSDTAQPGVTASGVNDAATTCLLTGPTPTASGPCTGGAKTFTGLANGSYQLSVTVRDAANNPTTALRNFSVNVVAVPNPDTTITTFGASSAPSSGSLTVVASTDVGAGIQYSVNGGTSWVDCAFVAATKVGTCTIPLSTFTSPGTANYKVRATASGGTVFDPSPDNGYTWVDSRPVKGTATVAAVANASTTAMGLAPDAPGGHPDVSTTVNLEGNEDARTVTIQLADGLMGSLAAVPKANRCTVKQGLQGTCPTTAEIASGTGTGVSVKYGALSGVGDVTGKVYMVDPDSPAADEAAGFPDIAAAYAAGGAVEITSPSHPDLGRIVVMGTLKVIDNGRALVIEVKDLPRVTNLAPETTPASWVPAAARGFHATQIVATVDGDKGYVPQASVTATNKSRPLITNPHYCGAPWAVRPTMKYIQGTAVTWTGTAITDGNTATGFAGKVSALYNTAATPCVTGQAFNPQILTASLSNPVKGETTGITANGTLGEEADAINANKPISTVTYASTQLPPYVGVSTPSVGANLDQCTVDTFVGTAPQEVFDTSIDRDPDTAGLQPACPPQAIVGTAYVDSPLVDTQLVGDIYYVVGSPIPNIGVKIAPNVQDPRWRAYSDAHGGDNTANPYKQFPNPQGIDIGIVGRTSVPDYNGNEWFKQINVDDGQRYWHLGNCVADVNTGQTCNDAIKVTITSLADVPIVNLNLQLGDRPTAWRPKVGGGTLDQNPLVVAGCTDPTFPTTESNGTRIGPPLVTKFTPYSKQTIQLNTATAIQTTINKNFQAITGCSAGVVPVEGALVDEDAPVVTITAPTSGQTIASHTVNATWSIADTVSSNGATPSGVDDTLTTCSLVGPTGSSGTCSGNAKTFTGLANGSYTLTVTAKDRSANSSANTYQRTFTVAGP